MPPKADPANSATVYTIAAIIPPIKYNYLSASSYTTAFVSALLCILLLQLSKIK